MPACSSLESDLPGSNDPQGLRELIIPFGRSGYVALFEIEVGDDYH